MTASESKRDWRYVTENPKLLEMELEDGTNVPPNTDYAHRPSMDGRIIHLNTHQGSPRTVASSFERVLAEFRRFRERARPVGAFMSQHRIPAYGENGIPPELMREERLLSGGPGASIEVTQLLSRSDMRPLVGTFPFMDAKGRFLLYTDGSPIAFHLGFSRTFTFFEPARAVHDNRELLTQRLEELCKEAGQAILALPAEALRNIWKRWRNTLCLPQHAEYLWLDALFEFKSIVRNHNQPIKCQVYSQSGYTSHVLQGAELFPRLKLFSYDDNSFAHFFPNEAG